MVHDPRKYKWYKYDSKKVDIDGGDHVLSLKRGELFGVRSLKRNYLVDESRALEMIITDADLERIRNNSKPYSGKVGRHIVVPGHVDAAEEGMLKINSSMFSSAHYDPKAKKLTVKFRNNNVWQYPATHKEVILFERAPSQGKYFNEVFRGRQGGQRIE